MRSPDFKLLVIVDGSEYLLNRLSEYKNVSKYHSYLEEFTTTTKYDFSIMRYVLEHIEYQVEVFKWIRNWVSKDVVIVI